MKPFALARLSASSFAKSTNNAGGGAGAHIVAELFHDRLVVLRQSLHRLFRLNLHDLIAAGLQLNQKLWQRHSCDVYLFI